MSTHCWPSPPETGFRLWATQAHDADEHAQQLTAWQQRYDQLGTGAFTGELVELRLPHIQIFREGTSQALRQSCRVWEDALWLGFADPCVDSAAGVTATRINGHQQRSTDVMVSLGDQDFELITPSHHSLFGLVVQGHVLRDAAQRQGVNIDWDGLRLASLLHVREALRATCLRLLDALLPRTLRQGLGAGAGWHPLPVGRLPRAVGSVPWLEATLVGAVLDILDTSEVDATLSPCHLRRQKVVAQARELVLSQPDQTLTIPDLCERLHVSRRTLQYCFETVMGDSPTPCLRAFRLNAVRRTLRAGSPQSLAVQDVATQWGFGHLSQFSCDYRKLFGEAPSATLKGR